MQRYRVWVVIINEDNKPQMKKGHLLSKFDNNHDVIQIDGKTHNVKIDRVFDTMQECLDKCKKLDNNLI